MRRITLGLAAAFLALFATTPDAHASRVDQVIQEGERLCDQLARGRTSDPSKLRSARKILERLAQERRSASKVTRKASKANTAANKAQAKYRALEQKLARNCKGKRGPLCYLTRASAERAHKKYNERVAEFRAADAASRAAQRRLDQMATAALNALRGLGSSYRR